MSVRVVTRDKINTAHINRYLTQPLYLQIMNALTREEMTFQELAEMLRHGEEDLSLKLEMLVKARVIERHFHHHAVLYTFKENRLKHTIRILYELWAERVRLEQAEKTS